MVITITNEAPFQVLTGAFTIGPSPTGYELQVGATPDSFTTLFSVGANTPRMVTNVANGSYYRLKNNVGDVKVNWSRTCVDNQGGGGSGSGATYTAGEYISIEQDVISVTGITPDQYLTSADTQDLASQAYVDAAITAGTQDLASQGYVNSAITAATQNMATQQDIQTAMASETARTENTYAKPGDIPSLDGYATEAYVTAATQNFMTEADVTAITNPIQTQLDDVERVTATALTELHDAVVEISGNTPDMSNYYDKDEVDAEITGATQGLATEAYVTSATQNMATHAEVTAATANLMTSAQTQAAITAATQNFITSAYTGFTSESDFEAFQADVMDKEEVVASALTELHDSIPDMSDYYTKDEVDAEVTGATQGFATQAYVTAATQNLASQGYVNSAITAATQNLASQAYVTSAVTAATQGMATQAYVTGITSPMQTAINNKVTNGGGISTIQKISQADYNDLVSGGTVDSYTFYVITGQTGN